MKKRLVFLALMAALLLLCLPALAQEAEDITAQCKVTASPGEYKITRLYDRKFNTTYVSNKLNNPYIELAASGSQKIFGVYVCFASEQVPAWEVQAKRGGDWVTVYESQGLYAHEFAPLDGEKDVRIRTVTGKKTSLTVSEIYAFGEGELPSWVQQWQPTPEKADLLVLSAHPDDEVLFFGGAIPYYAGERQMRVVVSYLTCGNMQRRSELLNGLWEMGLREYPVINTSFWDKYSKKLSTAYSEWGKSKVYTFITSLIRQYKPEVVLTHDVKGEYGHGAHQVCADAMLNCIPAAADPSKYSASAQQYGVWEVKKLYLHLYQENALEMDWDQPLEFFGGRTGYEVAVDAYGWHVSQHEAGQKNPKTGKFEVFIVEPRDSDYSCYRFGLAYTAVGPDVEKNDFFENIPTE